MPITIRRATPHDRTAMSDLLLHDAERRAAIDPALWTVAPDARTRIDLAFATIAQPQTGPMHHHWFVAEHGGSIVGSAHAVNLPAPPIFDLNGGNAGLLLDDTHLPEDGNAARALLEAVEDALRTAGASLFIAASPAAWLARTARLAESGYVPTTLYMAKARPVLAPPLSTVRRATQADVAGIARLGALSRAQLKQASPIFWNPHAEADTRFAAWMEASLGLADRAMFVSGPSAAVDGFAIAQPGSPLHLAPAHDLAHIGLIDDFHALSFEPDGPADTGHAPDLLAAAEGTLAAWGKSTVLVICPVRMARKAALLEAAGYRTANLWMVKSDRAA